MGTLYEDFTNIYPVSKTLRFELIPESETKFFLEKNGVLNSDEKRAEDYKRLKELLDRYYKAYIEEALKDVHLEGLDNYVSLYNIRQRNEEENASFKECQGSLRKQIVGFLEAGEKYGVLFKEEVVKKELPAFLTEKEDVEIAKSFKGFTTMCQGFWENRKNMFSDEEKATAIAYRIIHENLPKYIHNMKVFHSQIKPKMASELEDINGVLLDLAGVDTVDKVFSLDYFCSTLSQSGIEAYNYVLDGITRENKEKIQGLNELINLHNQNNPDDKVALLQQLYKQILSERSSVSFAEEKFDSDSEVINALNVLYDEFSLRITAENDSLCKMISKIEEYDAEGIFIKNGAGITDFSNKVFGEYRRIQSAWYDQYDVLHSEERTTNKYEEKRRSAYKHVESFSIELISSVTDTDTSKRIKDIVSDLRSKVHESFIEIQPLLTAGYTGSGKMIYDTKAVSLIKGLLDSMKELESFLRLFQGSGNESERDEMFYGEYAKYLMSLDRLIIIYNMTRNYMTKKAYSKEKVKLTFDSPTLLDGWDLNKETQNKAVILRKEGIYYLGIMEKRSNKVFVDYPGESEDCFEKLEYKQLSKAFMNLPRVFFAKKNIDYYAPSKVMKKHYDEKTHLKGKNFNLKHCHELIDFFKRSIEKNPDWKIFDFEFSDTSEYKDINDFYSEVDAQGYKASFRKVDTAYVRELVREGRLYLFKIYNKDFSPYSKGRPNLHTIYWKALFEERNMAETVYKLNGRAELFYRKKSISDTDRIVHAANIPIENRQGSTGKAESLFNYDIIKDCRYTVDKFQFHVPITMNCNADGRTRINSEVRKAVKHSSNMHIIGIDRGERHLLYLTVIDLEGNIKEQFSLNEILNEYNGTIHRVNYHDLLDKKEKERLEARQEWRTIENIKELKEGYLSHVVHVITKLMLKYNAIVVMEDLNTGFKRGRQKVEKQVYQKFEKALIDKLNYLVHKEVGDDDLGGKYRALQLTEQFKSFKSMGKQNGMLFYVPAWNTSKMDPTTGFVNLLYPKYESVTKAKAFINKIKDIRFLEEEDSGYFTFDIDYSDYTNKAEGSQTEWTVCSYGPRIITKRNSAGYWEDQTIDLTEQFKMLFESESIDLTGGLKKQILNVTNANFFKELMRLIKYMLQMRNSQTNGLVDYMQSPVKNKSGVFYNSNDVENGELPENADANGAYNIARKGLWIVKQFKEAPEDKLDQTKIAISNAEWLRFAQRI